MKSFRIAVVALLAAVAGLTGCLMSEMGYEPAMAMAEMELAEEPMFLEPSEGWNTEEYSRIGELPFLSVLDNPLSTLSIDVDTASYSNVRRFLRQAQMPPEDAVRIEELINYFSYDYPDPGPDVPFSFTVENFSI